MSDSNIRVGNAPCSWGVIENVEGERGGYAKVLDEMAETGFAGTELGDWGFMPTDPDEGPVHVMVYPPPGVPLKKSIQMDPRPPQGPFCTVSSA